MRRFCRQRYFNPRSPHGERHNSYLFLSGVLFISIHAPRTGSDLIVPQIAAKFHRFQSTLPARGATCSTPQLACLRNHFNPRSPHGERLHVSEIEEIYGNFNPRSPHGERPVMVAIQMLCGLFQSTLPARGATGFDRRAKRTGKAFQSTLPARGATMVAVLCRDEFAHFNPRSPHGERRYDLSDSTLLSSISIHAPRTGSDKSLRSHRTLLNHFNPRSPHGERRRR